MHRKNINYLVQWCLMFVLFSVSQLSSASLIHLEPLEKLAGQISTVIKAKVVSVEKGADYLKLKNGKKGPETKTHVTFSLENIEVLRGNFNSKNLRARFVWMMPATFDELGNVLTRASVSSPASGIESNVGEGKSYLFSFSHILQPETSLQNIYRIDELTSKDKLLDAIKIKSGT